jgi:hypothetical protein
VANIACVCCLIIVLSIVLSLIVIICEVCIDRMCCLRDLCAGLHAGAINVKTIYTYCACCLCVLSLLLLSEDRCTLGNPM